MELSPAETMETSQPTVILLTHHIYVIGFRPRGKESTEVRKSQINLSTTSYYPRMESNFSTCGGHPCDVWSRAMSDMNPSYTYSFARRQRNLIRTQRQNCNLSEYDFKNYFTTVYWTFITFYFTVIFPVAIDLCII